MKFSEIIKQKATSIIENLKFAYATNILPRTFVTVSGSIRYNRILDNDARTQYQPVIEQMFRYVPLMMQRKIPEANVQQAFVLDTVYKFGSTLKSPKILCVGSHEDTASASLKMIGYKIIEIDPSSNYNLEEYYNLPSTKKGSFNIIFSTSVIEHVDQDDIFIMQIADLLAPGGIVVLTCDFNNDYKPGDRLPKTDFRFYTKRDFIERLLPLIPSCSLIDEPNWDSPDLEFVYDNCRYTFATLVFRKEQ